MAMAASRKIAVGLFAPVVLVGAGLWSWSSWSGGGSGPAAGGLPEALSYDVMKTQAQADPAGLSKIMLEFMMRDDITDEQRRQIGQNMRKIFEEMMNERVEEYYAASEEDRNGVLDRHIDDFMARMKIMQENRAEWEKATAQRRENSNDNSDPGAGWRGMFGMRNISAEQRKAESESRNPDQIARRMAYFMASQKRMAERGIEMPWGRGNGGRGPGRGDGPASPPNG